jgi:hypothetical protein
MKKVLVALAFVSLTAVPALHASQAAAGTAPATKSTHPAKTASATQAPAHQAAGKTHVVNAEFVSYDAATKQITVKDDKGQTSTAALKGKAVGEAAHLKAGEKVMLTCHDNAKGEHVSVSAIKPASGKART